MARLPILAVCAILWFEEAFGADDNSSVVGGKTPLHVMGLFGMEGPWPGGHAMLAAVQMGFDHVNARPDILPNYELRLIWNNTKCSPGVGVDVMYRQLYDDPVKLMIIGAGCSPVSEATAQASHLWNILQISYVSASPSLTDKKRFPRFFRVSSPDQLVNPARIEMMKEFNWHRVATIHESTDLFSKVIDDVVLRFQENNITLISSEIFTDDPALQVKNLKRHDARIIVAGFYEDKVVKVFCEAYKVGMYGPKYVWIITGWYTEGWWDRVYASTDCTAEQLALAAEGAIGTGPVYINPRQERGVAGLTSDEWLAAYLERIDNQNFVGVPLAAMGYDAAWATAMALNFTDAHLTKMGSKRRLEHFSYTDPELTEAVFASMWDVQFQGIKGYIAFDKNGDNKGSVKIRRIQDGVRKVVGYFDPNRADPIDWVSPIQWEGGSPPLDSTTRLTEQKFVAVTTYTAICVVGALCIVLSTGFLVFNIVFRKERLIKMSSPSMNNVIVVGCIITYVTVFIQEISSESVLLLCRTRTFTMMVGFSLAFGALFAKTWRVYVIFTNTTKRTIVKDSQLLIVVAIIVGVDLVIFLVRELLDPQRAVPEVAETLELDGGDTIITREVVVCTSTYEIYFKGVVYTTKGLLLIFGAFLAWQTRKVTIPALNDSQYIGMCIYNVVVLSLLGVVLALVLSHQVELSYIFTSSFLIFGTTITQLIIFIPKIIKFKDIRNSVDSDEADNVTSTGFTSKPKAASNVAHSTSGEEEVESLRAQLDKTKTELKAAQTEVEKLRAENEMLKRLNAEGSTA